MNRPLFFLGSTLLLANFSSAQTWSAVGDGVRGRVAAITEYNGDLYVSGQGFFQSNNGIGIAKWNGTEFEALPGLAMFGAHRIEAMAVYDGYLFVGGSFVSGTSTFGSISNNIAKWDGSMWSTVGNGFNNVVYTFGTYEDELYAGGDFTTSGTVVCPKIARWDGDVWNSLNTVFEHDGRVSDIQQFNGELYIGGGFWAWNTNCVARWNGDTWSSLGGSGIETSIADLHVFNGELVAAGSNYLEVSGTPVNGMASFDGNSWTSLESYGGSPQQYVGVLGTYQGDLYAGGKFSTMGGSAIKGIARYDGVAWESVGTGIDSTGYNADTLIFGEVDTVFIEAPQRISAMFEFQGELYVGGEFNMIGGTEAHSIAKWHLPVSVEENMANTIVRIYPNPAFNTFHLEVPSSPGPSAVRMYDSTGRVVLQLYKPGVGPIDISQLGSGMYEVELALGDHIVRKKLSIIR